MAPRNWKIRDFLAETDYTREEIEHILDLSIKLKDDRRKGIFHDDLLCAKMLFTIFYDQSLRTRNSFEAGMTQPGGHVHFLVPGKIYTPAIEGKE